MIAWPRQHFPCAPAANKLHLNKLSSYGEANNSVFKTTDTCDRLIFLVALCFLLSKNEGKAERSYMFRTFYFIYCGFVLVLSKNMSKM